MKLIASLLVFYPLIIPLWEKGPLDMEDVTLPDRVSFLNDAGVASQVRLYPQFDTPEVRSAIASDFAKFHNPKAVAKLVVLLASEKNPMVQADILNSLLLSRNVAACGRKDLLWKFAASDNPSVRGKAIVLYLDNGGALDTVLERLVAERSIYVRNVVWDAVSSSKITKPGDAVLRKLLASEYPENRAGAVAFLGGISGEPDGDSDLAKVVADTSAFARAALAKTLASRKSGGVGLLKRLASDDSAIVRGFVATSSSNPEMLGALVGLAGDHDPETRRLAVISLGSFKSTDAIDTVLKAFSDKELSVRTAAESAIAEIAPGDGILERVGGALLDASASRSSAVSALGLLGAEKYAERIKRVLDASNDDDLSLRCVVALGRLNYKPAWKAVAAKAGCQSPKVRREVAWTLGVLAEKGAFGALSRLSRDDDLDVTKEALRSMGEIGDPVFTPDLMAAAKRVDKTPCDIRSSACWGLARSGSPKPDVLNWLRALALKKIIPSNAGKDYDADHVRASAILALVELGKRNAKAKSVAADVLKRFATEGDGDALATLDTTLFGDALKDFARQIKAYMDGNAGDMKPTPMPLTSPILTVEPIKRKK
jgi:HEAT repeat protein